MNAIWPYFKVLIRTGLGVPIGLLLLLAMMLLPIPTPLLDLFFTFSIALAILILLASLYCERPMDFAAFPTVLLLATLMRLALNIASTRVVLLHGHNGSHAAGKVIEAFGAVVIGNDYTVGIVIFAILIIINFIVITKGAGRISEVNARFTLDSLPGKQMAIDADLNAGLIEQNEAKSRRLELAKEADFYGSMDGASKFIRGDAVAGILILVINMIGGTLIGFLQHRLSFVQAFTNYAILTIGDGLAAQIPALILSTAAAIMVARSSYAEDISSQVVNQIFYNHKALLVAAAVMAIMGVIPGMPHMAFLSLAAVLLLISLIGQKQITKLLPQTWLHYIQNWQNKHQNKLNASGQELSTNNSNNLNNANLKANNTINPGSSHIKSGVGHSLEQPNQQASNNSNDHSETEFTWDELKMLDLISLELGYRLIPLVDSKQDGSLMGKIRGIRKKLSQELGFLIPSVHVQDNLDLQPHHYRISISGIITTEDKVYPEQFLAINPGNISQQQELEGTKVLEPAFGLDAVWIEATKKQFAQSLGYTVVDPGTVIATNLSQVIYQYAYKLLGYQEVKKLLDLLAQDSQTLIETLTPKLLSLAVIVKVLQNLLTEQINIKNLRTIAEALIEGAAVSQDPQFLTEYVRVALRHMILQQLNGKNLELQVVVLDNSIENMLEQTIQAQKGQLVLDPELSNQLQTLVQHAVQAQDKFGLPQVLLCTPALRPHLAKLLKAKLPNLSVLSYAEIPESMQLRTIQVVGAQAN